MGLKSIIMDYMHGHEVATREHLMYYIKKTTGRPVAKHTLRARLFDLERDGLIIRLSDNTVKKRKVMQNAD